MASNKTPSKLGVDHRHICSTISSCININGSPETIWNNITNVRIEQFSGPKIFRILGIPRPLRADLLIEGGGGQRIAYFDSGKKFIQEITTWKPLEEYSFNFNPEKGFKVCYLFDISDGIFRVPNGSYFLTTNQNITTLRLSTTYSLDRRVFFLFNVPARLILKIFQRHLLASIKKNSERNGKHQVYRENGNQMQS